MTVLYKRKIELLTDTKKFSANDYTINFEIPFDDGVEPNIATIQIYNLSEKTINELKKGSKAVLNAGYEGDIGAAFIGSVRFSKTEWQGVDKITTLECIDSGEMWFERKLGMTYKQNSTGKQILTDLLKRTGLSVGALKLPTNKVYKRGKTVKGTLMEGIAEIAKDCGAKVHVTRNKIYVRPKSEGDEIFFVINSNRGLIGSPSQIEKEEVIGKDKDKNDIKRTVRGWKIVSLLNHRLTTDAIIEVKSKTANGKFRIEKGKHYGGNKGQNFYTEMEVYPL